MASNPVHKYRLIVRTNNEPRSYNLISLYGINHNHLGNLKFTDDEPPSVQNPSNFGYPIATYPREAYAEAVDLLRNESPVTFEINFSTATLRTGTHEQVGEDDG